MNGLVQRLRFFAGDAWDEFKHSPGVNLLAAATLAAVLSGAGLVALVFGNVERFAVELRRDVRIEVYLQDGIEPQARAALRAGLEAFEGVTRVDYIDKGQALERYSVWAGEMAELAQELETNPLPASFEVFLAPGPAADEAGLRIQQRFGAHDGVEQVRFDRELLGRVEALLTLARVGGGAFGLLILGTVVFVMSSVLRLAVYARRDEIEIMLLVGATPAFVRGPFLVAGVVQGLLSSGAALASVELTRRAALAYAGRESLALLDLFLAEPMPGRVALLLLGVGLAVSCVAAWFAVRQSHGLRGARG